MTACLPQKKVCLIIRAMLSVFGVNQRVNVRVICIKHNMYQNDIMYNAERT